MPILPVINTISNKSVSNHIISNIKEHNLIIPKILDYKIINNNQSQELLKIRKLEKDKIKNNKNEELNKMLNKKILEEKIIITTEENKNKELEIHKNNELRQKYELIAKLKEEKLREEMDQVSSSEKKKILEKKQSTEMQRLMINEEKKEKYGKEKIIEQIKLIEVKEKELELKELNLENNVSKHEFRLDLLNELVNQYLEIYKSNNIKKILEIIHKIGKLFKNEINYDREYCKDNILYMSDAVKSYNMVYKFLGVLGEEFYKYNIYSIIEKKSEDINLMDGVFKVLLSQYSTLPKFKIKINSMSLKLKILKNPKEYFEFIDNFKRKISKEYYIPIDKLYIISQKNDKYEFTVVILDKQIISLKSSEKIFNINVSKKNALLEYVKLSPNFFETKFNRNINSWEKIKFRRGGEKYYPPYGWKGFALKV